jgi:hypothetical protein
LKSGVFILSRLTLADVHGQPVAQHLSAVQLHNGCDFPWSMPALERLIGKRTLREADHEGWIQLCQSTHQAFWSSRLERERAIAVDDTQAVRMERQPGLFDARAERAWIDEEDRRISELAMRRWNIDQAMRMAVLDSPPPQVALVLFTR